MTLQEENVAFYGCTGNIRELRIFDDEQFEDTLFPFDISKRKLHTGTFYSGSGLDLDPRAYKPRFCNWIIGCDKYPTIM